MDDEELALHVRLALSKHKEAILTRDIKNKRKQIKRANPANWRQLIREPVRCVALCVVMLDAYRVNAAAAFVATHMKRRGLVINEEATLHEVREWFLALDNATLMSMLSPLTARERAHLRKAHIWLAGCKLKTWVRAMNLDRGAAPSSTSCLATFYKECQGIQRENNLSELDPSVTLSASWYQRQWAYRYRMRWGVNIGKIRHRENITPELLHEKASSGTYLKHPKLLTVKLCLMVVVTLWDVQI